MCDNLWCCKIVDFKLRPIDCRYASTHFWMREWMGHMIVAIIIIINRAEYTVSTSSDKSSCLSVQQTDVIGIWLLRCDYVCLVPSSCMCYHLSFETSEMRIHAENRKCRTSTLEHLIPLEFHWTYTAHSSVIRDKSINICSEQWSVVY